MYIRGFREDSVPPRTQAVDEVFDLLGVGGYALLGWKRLLITFIKQERGVDMHDCSEGTEDGGGGKREDDFRRKHQCFTGCNWVIRHM